MKIEAIVKNPKNVETDILVLSIFEDKEFSTDIKEINVSLDNIITELLSTKEFEPKEGNAFVFPTFKKIKPKNVLLVGLGKRENFMHDTIRRYGDKIIKKVMELKIKKIAVTLPLDSNLNLQSASRALLEGIVMGGYQFKEYKTEDAEKFELQDLKILVSNEQEIKLANNGAKIGKIIGESVNYVRDLGNHPSNVMTPTKLEEEAKKIARIYGLTCKVFSLEEAKKMGMGAFYSVAKGSNEPAKFIILEYNMSKKDLPIYAVVGKGITFDSGGLSLKPSESMEGMKYDMLGAASVLGIMKIIAELKVPIRLVGVMPATENMPSGSASKPGDVVKSYSGVTIEILNTDAEGRLILADALGYVSKNYSPKAIIDLATLTGACVIALGHHAIGLFTKDDELAEKLLKAGEETWDRAWRLPLWDDYYKQIKSDVADVKNIGGRPAGAITAAAFLSKFLVNNCKWAHLDIAGAGMTKEPKAYLPKGATGAGVRLVAQFLLNEVESHK